MQMQQAEIEKLVDALLFDHRIEPAPGTGPTSYRSVKRRKSAGAFASIPCGVCPVSLCWCMHSMLLLLLEPGTDQLSSLGLTFPCL